LILQTDVYMDATWFNYYRFTYRPEYILCNNSLNNIYRESDELFMCFFGKLYILDTNSIFQQYKFGSSCISFVCADTISHGQTINIVEGYPHGNPRKLISGYYKYSVKFKDMNEQIKTLDTYFSVIYSK